MQESIKNILKFQGYSALTEKKIEDVQSNDFMDDFDYGFFKGAVKMIKSKELVLASSTFIHTPTHIDEVTSIINGLPEEHRWVAQIAIQMTINYINSKTWLIV